MGEIIARFHAGYVKETPADYVPDSRDNADLDQWRLYLEKIVYPDRKLMPQHRRWITFTLKMVVNSLLEKCGEERRGEFLRSFLRYYRAPERLGDETAFQLLETATALPFSVCDERQRRRLMHFAQALSARKDLTVRSAAVLLLSALYPWLESAVPGALRSVDCAGSASLARLRDTALASAGVQAPPPPLDEEAVAEIFLDNLKSGTPWIVKEVNIRLLAAFAASGGAQLLHIATHLANLIKVSDRVTVRHAAGSALLAIAPRLTADQRNEVAVELVRGLEIDQQEFSKYIPDYLGQLCLWLPPAQLEEVAVELNGYLGSSNSRVVAAALDTVGVIYESYDAYRVRFPEEDEVYRKRRERLLGMLLKGLAGFRSEVRQEALFVLGRRVFGAREAAGLPPHPEEAPGPRGGGPGAGADLLLPRRHAGPGLSLHHRARHPAGGLPVRGEAARGLLPRHLRPLHPLP